MTAVSMRVDTGGIDLTPHTFIVVTHPDGRSTEYGFVPRDGGLAGVGAIDITGSGVGKKSHESQFKGSIQNLTDVEYQRLMEFVNRSIANPPEYIVLGPRFGDGTNCTGWAVDAWRYAGLPDSFAITSSWTWNPYGQAIAIVISDLYRRAIAPRPRDPLAIDLDGDGIETIGIPTSGNPILFDHDADSVKTGTGWLKGDDAWLVMDRNGNGSIDSGRELFGVDTLIPATNGGTRNATSGFDALMSLDTGSGSAGSAGYRDNVFNASDAAFANVRVWKDINQDGVSQASELLTLTAAGIAAVSLVPTTTNTNLGNGNTLTGTATVTRTNGSSTQAGSVDLTAGNLNLANNPFYREFTDTIPLTETALAMPEMGGSGWLRDLREAMSLDSSAADRLGVVTQQFAQAGTRDAQMELIDELLTEWAGSSTQLNSTWATAHAGSTATTLASEVVTTTEISNNGSTKTLRHIGAGVGMQSYANLVQYEFSDADLMTTVLQQSGFSVKAVNGLGQEWLHRRNVLEAFNGQRFFSMEETVAASSGGSGSGSGGGGGGGGGAADPSLPVVRWRVTYDATQRSLIDQSYAALRESVYSALAVQTRLRPYLDSIELIVDDSGISFDTQALAALLNQRKSGDMRNASIDLLELNQFAHGTLAAVGFDGLGTLRQWRDTLAADAPLRTELAQLGLLSVAQTAGTDRADVYLGDGASNSFSAGAGNDVLDGAAGNDSLSAADGDDFLYGGDGNDTLQGGNGNDILDGGAGNDALTGGIGNNVYLFGKGDGQDSISSSTLDTTVGKLNALQFKAGVLPNEVVVKQVSGSLELSISGTADKVTINGFFQNDDPANGYNGVQQIKFADGTIWDFAILQTKAFAGTDINDSIRGTIAADTIIGAGGADVLNGAGGNDVLYGDARPETIIVRAKATLAGDVGAMMAVYLNGQVVGTIDVRSSGFADYAFKTILPLGTDSKLDVVFVNDALIDGQDRNLMIESVRVGTHLMKPADAEVKIDKGIGTAAFDGQDLLPGSGVVAWNAALRFVVTAVAAGGQSGDDSLSGEAGDDTLDSGSGNDTLQGGTGNDTMDGGAGNDVLAGDYANLYHGWYSGLGNDTYRFGRGDGQDDLYDLDSTAGNLDKLVFKAGVAPTDVVLRRSANSLVAQIKGTTDQITLRDYFTADGTSGWMVEEIRFTDSTATVWKVATVKAMVLNGTTGNDMITGYASADTLNGNDGDDTLDACDGNDTLNGGTGNDAISGNAGDDTLLGGTGNDMLHGGTGNDTMDGGAGNDVLAGDYANLYHGWYSGLGNDTYRFGRGDGQDDLYDLDSTAGNLDKLVFKAGVAPTDVVLRRSANSLVAQIKGTTDQITLRDYFTADGTSGWMVEEIRFTDSTATVWKVATVKAMVLNGTTGNDMITGYASADTLNGNDGDDTLDACDGNDTLNGGTGNDAISGNAGDDTLLGGTGNDMLHGGTGNDTMDGGAGNDVLAGDYANLYHGWYSGLGNDTYRFGRGDGQDDLYDLDSTAGNLDKLVFKAGVAPTDVVLRRSANSLVAQIKGTTDQITLRDYFTADGTSGWMVEEIRFTDSTATVWKVATVKAMVLNGTTGNDMITGYASADTLNGNDGDDTLDACDGNDTLNGGTGNDAISGNAGDDTLLGGTGNDMLHGGTGNDTMDGGAGNDVLAGDYANLYHGWYSGLGNDTYRFGRGDGQDNLYDLDTTTGNLDKLVFKAGVAPTDVALSRLGDSLVAQIKGTTDQITVNNYFTGDAAGGWAVEEIRFNDSSTTVWNVATVKAVVLNGTTGRGSDSNGTTRNISATSAAALSGRTSIRSVDDLDEHRFIRQAQIYDLVLHQNREANVNRQTQLLISAMASFNITSALESTYMMRSSQFHPTDIFVHAA